MSRTHPSVQPAIQTIVEGFTAILGTNLSKIVLLGSAIRDDFDPAISDVDVAILVNVPPSQIFTSVLDLKLKLEDEFSIDCQFAIRERIAIERWCEFELAWEGKVTRGETIFDSGDDLVRYRLTRDEAKMEIIEHYIAQADLWLQRGLNNRDDDFRRLAEWEACRATCRALQAVLLQNDIDPSPKSMRWNIRSLFDAAATACNRLQSVHPYLEKLPPELALQEKGSVLLSDEPQPARQHVRSVFSRSKKIIAACKRGIDE